MISFDIINRYICFFITGLTGFFSTVYVFYRALNLKPSKRKIYFLSVSGFLYCLLVSGIDFIDASVSGTLTFFVTATVIAICERENRTRAIVISLIAKSLTYFFSFVSAIISGTVVWLLGYAGYSEFDILVHASICILTFLFSFIFMRIKRFRRGFQFFGKTENLGLGLMIAGVMFILTNITYQHNINKIIFYIIFFGILIGGFGLYLWIRKSITNYYRQRLQLKSELYYKEKLEEGEKTIAELTASNQYLSKVVHRDNHLMSALDRAINEYLACDDSLHKDELLGEILTMSRERGELIRKEQSEAKILPSTGSVLIDGALNDMFVKASAHGIDFNLMVGEKVNYLIHHFLSQTELETLLCDHIKDAIIAIDADGSVRGKILVSLSMSRGIFSITVSDNGVEFTPETLSGLGTERVTTHADNGGSGIGFMTTFETLRKSAASLIITEFESKNPFSKSITFRFDDKGRFVIKSYRKKLLKQQISRKDLTFA